MNENIDEKVKIHNREIPGLFQDFKCFIKIQALFMGLEKYYEIPGLFPNSRTREHPVFNIYLS